MPANTHHQMTQKRGPERMELFDRAGLMEATKLSPRKLSMLLYLLKGPKLNRIYNKLENKQGLDMIEEALAYLKIDLDYDKEALERVIPNEGPFLTISNHPFGFLDGIILILLIGRKRPDFRVVANYLLSYFAPISDQFITVNPFENRGPKALGGSRKALAHVKTGAGMGMFPAGEVSTWYKGQKGIADKPWPTSSVRLAVRTNVPIIPIYFHGQNSNSFHLLGKMHPALRTLRIPAEFLKKQRSTIHLGIGDAIDPAMLKEMKGDKAMGDYLRKATYDLGTQFVQSK